MSELLYQEYRQFMFPVAYNILQDREEAEDVVQDTILSWLNRDTSGIDNARGYLIRAVINKCLNRIRDRKKSDQIEIAPELLLDYIPSLIENKDKISYTLLMMMERLSPLERAVFILKEIFDYTHKEIAALLGISEAYSRQILVRAKRHIQLEEERYEVDTDHHLQLYERFVEVCDGRDLSGLIEILREDVRLDQAGLSASAGIPTLRGKFAVAEQLLFLAGGLSEEIGFETLYREGIPLLVVYLWNNPIAEIYLTGDSSLISKILIHWKVKNVEIALPIHDEGKSEAFSFN